MAHLLLHRLLAPIALCAFLLTMPAAAAAAPCADSGALPGEVSKQRLGLATVCLVNRERATRGRSRLRLDKRLSKAARSQTLDMVRKRYFSHTSRSGDGVVSRLRRTGYMRGARRWTVGENLAWGTGANSTPRIIVSAWMKSRGHRANILASSFREIGIGVAFGAPKATRRVAGTFTATFGARS